MNNTGAADSFKKKKIMITGGLGMIGSTIANKLVERGADVTIVDSCLEPYGANIFNIRDIENSVSINIKDIRDKEAMKVLVKDKDIIYNLAGQVSHNDSLKDPFLDADINYLGHLNVLECARNYNPEAVIFHSGSRLQFGRIGTVPVNEEHPLRPRTPYALNKTAAENMYIFYNEVHNIRCVIFRIANPYGPRSQMKHSKYSMINWFIRQAMENKKIKIFGDGTQMRDYIFVDDLADAIILSSVTPSCYGEVFNVGSGIGTRFLDMAKMIVETVGSGGLEYVEWPSDYINVETGDYITDIQKIQKMTGWSPKTGLKEGIERTCEYYRKNRQAYW